MTYHLLYDAHCTACSRVARLVAELDVPSLDVASLHEPDIQQRFADAGRPAPTGPALIDTAGTLRVWTGFAMRVRLARLVGVRRSSAIVRLLAAEAAARSERASEQGGGDRRRLGRRGILAAGVAGIGAAVFGRAAAASAQPAKPGEPSMSALPDATRQRVLASPAARQAVAAWGTVDTAAARLVTGADGTRVTVLPHAGTSAVTYLDASGAEPVGITLAVDRERGSLRYHLTDGRAVVEQTLAADGTVQTTNLVQPGDPAHPDSLQLFAICFAACVGINVGQSCINTCASCANGGWDVIYNCPICAACAGVNGVRCAKDCLRYL